MIDVRSFPSDIPTRRRWFKEESFSHPAKAHLGLLQFLIDRYTAPGDTIGDPMCGVGSIAIAATQQRNVIMSDVEPRWLALAHENAANVYHQAGLLAGSIDVRQVDAGAPWGWSADSLIFSPPYACRASVNKGTRVGILSHRMRKLEGLTHSQRWEYLFKREDESGAMGAQLFHYGEHPQQIGHFRGARYWEAMERIYTHAHAALRGGVMALILKDHIREGQHVQTTRDTITLCERLGFVLVAHHQRRLEQMSLWQRRRKERGEPVIDVEDAIVFRKAAP